MATDCLKFLQKYYKLPEERSYDDHARCVFHHNAHIVVRDMISYARIQVVASYLERTQGIRFEKKRDAGKYYLTEEQYSEVNCCKLQLV
jgi:hypothetical protein